MIRLLDAVYAAVGMIWDRHRGAPDTTSITGPTVTRPTGSTLENTVSRNAWIRQQHVRGAAGGYALYADGNGIMLVADRTAGRKIVYLTGGTPSHGASTLSTESTDQPTDQPTGWQDQSSFTTTERPTRRNRNRPILR